MAYRPPTTSKWSQPRKSEPDADGWQTVGKPKPATKWGESTLKKAAPPAPTHDELFPAFPTTTKKSVSPTSPVETKPSFADLMKARLAAEEEEKNKADAERNRRAEEEKNTKGPFIPVTSILASRSIAQNFAYQEPEEDTEYYNEYPEHWEEDKAPPQYHDYEEDVDYTDDY